MSKMTSVICEEIKVGYTLLSENDQLYRVDKIDGTSLEVTRVAYVETSSRQERKTVESLFIFPLQTVRTKMRILSRSWERFSAYLANNEGFINEAQKFVDRVGTASQDGDLYVWADDIRSVAEELDCGSAEAARVLDRRIGGSVTSYIKCIRPKEVLL